MSQRSIQTSLIRPLGGAALGSSLEAPPIQSDCSVLAVGELGAAVDALELMLRELGAELKVAHAADGALALLDQQSPACIVIIDSGCVEDEVAEFVRRVRLDPERVRLPVLFLTSSDVDATPSSSDGRAVPRAHSLRRRGLLLADRSAPDALRGQLAVLLDLHRARSRALGLEAQLDYAQRDLRKTSDDNAQLAEQARRTIAELETAQAQLVQAAKLAALGELVAGVAHEINNPLSFSLSHMSTLRRGINRSLSALGEHAPETRSESARLEERLVGVGLGLDRIKSLVAKLQTFSRLDDGKPQAVDVADAIGTVLTILHHRLRDRIHVTTEFGKPEVIQCDPSLINQCVMNLMVNAIDAIDALDVEGSIHLSARTEGDSYIIRVRDSGLGVSPEIEHRIFDPFFTTKPVGKGTGLGLSIAASVVKKHEGTLTLSPGASGGTEAVIRIPLGRVAAPRRR